MLLFEDNSMSMIIRKITNFSKKKYNFKYEL